MGMFDWYKPDAELKCPACDVALHQWQGKDGPSALFVWRENVPFPIAQEAGEWSIPKGEREELRLPPAFGIYSYDCGQHAVSAIGICTHGVWAKTEITEVRPARSGLAAS